MPAGNKAPVDALHTTMPAKPAWNPLPDGPIEQLEENLWTIPGHVAGMPRGSRRMSIARRGDGKLVFYDSFAVDDEKLAAIRAFGEPAYQIITNVHHCREVAAFKDRLGVKTYCARAVLDAVQRRVQVDGVHEELPLDPSMELLPVDGLKTGEAWLLVRSGVRVSVLMADSVMWFPEGNWIVRLMRLVGPEPKVAPPFFRLLQLVDRRAFRGSFERLLDSTPITRIVPCHGPVIDRDPVARIRRALDVAL